ncbi:MAG: glycosyltransferase [Actinomycetota bacterium]
MTGAEGRRALLVIITYNSFDLLPDIAESIREFESDNPGNFALVIENSGDRHVGDYFASNLESKRVFVHVSDTNLGFSHGVNAAYALAQEIWGRFDFVVLLNPDVLSAGRTVSELVNRASRDSEAEYGIWSAPLRNEQGRFDKGCARREWNLRRLFSDLLGYPPLAKVLMTSSRHLTQQEIEHDQSELALVSGALMCIRARIFADGLDTYLPMYLEDQEICLRSIRNGLKVHLYPDLEAIHLGGVSRKSNPSVQRALRIMENVEAPVQCMCRIQGYSLTTVRPVVFFGGLARLAIAPIVAGFHVLFRRADVNDRSAWLSDQFKLGYWSAWWAVRGKYHESEISLSEYFREYARE